jgi:flagellar biosynthesis chaperone FliJ
VVEELRNVRLLQDVRNAERDLATAVRTEQGARAGYADAHRGAEVVRRAQDKKRAEIVDERERKEQRELDELATMRFNVGR